MVKLLEQDFAAQPDDTHRAIWRWLSENSQDYPDGINVSPLKSGAEPRRDPTYAGAECHALDIDGELQPRLLGVTVSAGGDAEHITDLDDDGGPARLAERLFCKRRRGTVYVFAEGGRRDLHLIFRHCYRVWVDLGFTIGPNAAGTYLKALTVRKDKHAWHLVDLRAFVGLEDLPSEDVTATFAAGWPEPLGSASSSGIAAGVYANIVREHFGVTARLTSGSTAIAAMARHIPDDSWLWKPSALAVTLSRIGGGFRGGYCYYPSYKGPGYKIDMRRAYSYALTKELPCGTGYGRCDTGNGERAGLFLCRVQGPGQYPVVLAPWNGPESGFRRRLWNGDYCHCVLPQSEFAGLRALGYAVQPGWGAVYRSTVSLAAFVQQANRLAITYGPDSPQGKVGKALCNRVYGKFAERPERTELAFSAADPGTGYQPLVDTAGDEVDDAWSYERVAYRSHQHIDVAAEITAVVRTRLYTAMARLGEAGVDVLAADTDGLVISHRATGVLALDTGALGGWRDCGYDPDITIAGPRFATIVGRTISAGTSRQPATVVSLAFDKGVVSVEGKVMAPAWSQGPMHSTVTRRLTRSG